MYIIPTIISIFLLQIVYRQISG